jgi:hypothetical protein
VIASGLATNRGLQVLTLSCNNIRSTGTPALLAALLTSQVTELHLASNHPKDDVSPHFAILLVENPLAGRGIAAIGPAMATNQSLLKLNVSASAGLQSSATRCKETQHSKR